MGSCLSRRGRRSDKEHCQRIASIIALERRQNPNEGLVRQLKEKQTLTLRLDEFERLRKKSEATEPSTLASETSCSAAASAGTKPVPFRLESTMQEEDVTGQVAVRLDVAKLGIVVDFVREVEIATTVAEVHELRNISIDAVESSPSVGNAAKAHAISSDLSDTSSSPLSATHSSSRHVESHQASGSIKVATRGALKVLLERMLDFVPEPHDFTAFGIPKAELAEDEKSVDSKKRFGPITIRHPNQLRLVCRTVFDYVSKYKSSKMLCQLTVDAGNFDFSEAMVRLSFAYMDALPILNNSWAGGSKFNGLPDLSTSYYLDQLERFDVLIYLPESAEELSDLPRWFTAMWSHVLEHIPEAATLPTNIKLSASAYTLAGAVATEPLSTSFEPTALIPNNFERLDFTSFSHLDYTNSDIFHANVGVYQPLANLIRHILIVGRASINHVRGPLPYILALEIQQEAGTFARLKHVGATFDETLQLFTAANPNPLAQLASSYPSIEVLQLFAYTSDAAVTMDLSPLRQLTSLREFTVDGLELSWPGSYADSLLNPPSKWDIQHENVRSMRLSTTPPVEGASDDVFPSEIRAFCKLLNFASANSTSLDVRNLLTVKQCLGVFGSGHVKPQLADVRSFSLSVKGGDNEAKTAEHLEDVFRLFALIERAMPNLSSLRFGSSFSTGQLPFGPTDNNGYEETQEIDALLRLLKNRPKQITDLTLCGCFTTPYLYLEEDLSEWDEVLLICLRCLIETDLVSLTVWSEASQSGDEKPYWPLDFCHKLASDPGIFLKQWFNQELSNKSTKGRRLISTKLYLRRLDEQDEFFQDIRNLVVVEIRCVLANPSNNARQYFSLMLVQEERFRRDD